MIYLQFVAKKKKVHGLLQPSKNIHTKAAQVARRRVPCESVDEVHWALNDQSSVYPILISGISSVPQILQYGQKPAEVTRSGKTNIKGH